jgi:hypothetical protein
MNDPRGLRQPRKPFVASGEFWLAAATIFFSILISIGLFQLFAD